MQFNHYGLKVVPFHCLTQIMNITNDLGENPDLNTEFEINSDGIVCGDKVDEKNQMEINRLMISSEDGSDLTSITLRNLLEIHVLRNVQQGVGWLYSSNFNDKELAKKLEEKSKLYTDCDVPGKLHKLYSMGIKIPLEKSSEVISLNIDYVDKMMNSDDPQQKMQVEEILRDLCSSVIL